MEPLGYYNPSAQGDRQRQSRAGFLSCVAGLVTWALLFGLRIGIHRIFASHPGRDADDLHNQLEVYRRATLWILLPVGITLVLSVVALAQPRRSRLAGWLGLFLALAALAGDGAC